MLFLLLLLSLLVVGCQWLVGGGAGGAGCGLGFGVWGLGVGVWGFGFGVGLGCVGLVWSDLVWFGFRLSLIERKEKSSANRRQDRSRRTERAWPTAGSGIDQKQQEQSGTRSQNSRGSREEREGAG